MFILNWFSGVLEWLGTAEMDFRRTFRPFVGVAVEVPASAVAAVVFVDGDDWGNQVGGGGARCVRE